MPPELRDQDNLRWYWAACAERDGEVYLSSSRAGAFVGIGDSLATAERIAEDAIGKIEGPVRHRRDIGRADVLDARVRHVNELRAGAARRSHSRVAA